MLKLPHNNEYESAMIGLSVLNGRIASLDLSTADFYGRGNQAMWGAIVQLDEESQELTPFEIVKIAKQSGCDLSVSELMGMATGIPPAMRVEKQVTELRELSKRRFLIRELYAQAEHLSDSGDADEVIALLEDKFDSLRTAGELQGFVSLEKVIDTEVKPALDELFTGVSSKLSTGFLRLDHVIGGGMTPGDVMLIVSDTGSGKSALALQIADQISQLGHGVAFASGEMRNRENGLRLLSRNAETTNLNAAVAITDPQRQMLTRYADHIKTRPIYFDHTSTDLQALEKNLTALCKTTETAVLVIDYVQLYKLTKNDNLRRVERLTEVSQQIKRLANRFNLCVILVAQLNREGAKSERATMHHLEGSGQLEKDCSTILIIDREDGSDKVTVRLEKGRNSGKTSIEGRFTGRTLQFDL